MIEKAVDTETRGTSAAKTVTSDTKFTLYFPQKNFIF